MPPPQGPGWIIRADIPYAKGQQDAEGRTAKVRRCVVLDKKQDGQLRVLYGTQWGPIKPPYDGWKLLYRALPATHPDWRITEPTHFYGQTYRIVPRALSWVCPIDQDLFNQIGLAYIKFRGM